MEERKKYIKNNMNKSVELFQEILHSENSDLMVEAAHYYYYNCPATDFFESLNLEERALKLLEKAVKLDNNWARIDLGDFYRRGTDYIAKNPVLANNLYYDAAENGNQEAMLKLGEMYLNEFCEEDENYQEALFWFKKAAKFGCANAYYQLGNMYEEGLGVEEDGDFAYSLKEKAALLGDEQACCELNIFPEE